MTVDFTNFHDRTRADFTMCARPDRPADFISESGSEYWDCGHGVIRAADHWVSQNGCYGIRSCVWTLNTALGWRETAAGYCSYADFIVRREVPVWHTVSRADRAVAAELDGRAVAVSDWTTGTGRSTRRRATPAWAREVAAAGSADRKVRRLLRERPRVQRAIVAEQRVVRAILGGAGKIKIGSRLE